MDGWARDLAALILTEKCAAGTGLLAYECELASDHNGRRCNMIFETEFALNCHQQHGHAALPPLEFCPVCYGPFLGSRANDDGIYVCKARCIFYRSRLECPLCRRGFAKEQHNKRHFYQDHWIDASAAVIAGYYDRFRKLGHKRSRGRRGKHTS